MLKFTILGYYGNKGGSRKISNDSLWLPDPQTPSFVKILGLILNASWVIAIFVWKFQNFRYHGNRGWSDTNFSHTVISADPENPMFGARILMISHARAEL